MGRDDASLCQGGHGSAIVAPQEDIDSAEHKAQCERLVFTPWHSLAAHQPIGSINRLRKAVYEASAQHRLRQPEGTLASRLVARRRLAVLQIDFRYSMIARFSSGVGSSPP